MKTAHEAELLARKFHDYYEELAPLFGYTTRPETRQFDPNSKNGKLMIEVCACILAHLRSQRDGNVVVPREPKPGLRCGDVAVSTDPRYAGWVFVRHIDGENWTTCAKMTAETWAMLAAAKEG